MLQRKVLLLLKNLPNDTNAALALKADLTYVDKKVADLVDSAPGTLDTLNELAKALGEDPNFATTIATQLGTKSDIGHTHKYEELTDKPGVSYFENDALYLTKVKDIPNLDILTKISESDITEWNTDPTWETLQGKPTNFMYVGMPVSDLENDAKYVNETQLKEILNNSVELAHTHGNKELLDTITNENWNSKTDVIYKSVAVGNWVADSELFAVSITMDGMPAAKSVQYVNVKDASGNKIFVDYSAAGNVITIVSTQAYDCTVEVVYSTPVLSKVVTG